MKPLIEFIGTFFLVSTVGLTVIDPGAGLLAPLAIGLMLAAMVYAGGPFSGAHYNPAVTLAVWLRGRCSGKDSLRYVAAQLVAGVAAALFVLYLKKNPAIEPATPDPLRALAAELVFTFALCFVVLHVATTRAAAGNSYFGAAIGLTVTAGAYAAGPISGAAFNPAVAAGITVMGLSSPANIWIFVAGNFLGGAAAGLAFRRLHPGDK